MTDWRGWDTSGKDALEEAIQDAFGISIKINSIEKAPGGHNQDTHDVLETESEGKIGVKICSQGPQEGVENEVLAYVLADELGLPNAGEAEILEPRPEYRGPFDAKQFLAVRWLKGAEELGANKGEVLDHNRAFLEQYGEWAPFTTALGVVDRSPDNFVWVAGDHQLAHIDFESALERDPWARKEDVFYENLKLHRSYGNLQGGNWASDPDYGPGLSLKRGLEEGHELLIDQADELRTTLEAYGVGASLVDSVLEWVYHPVGDKVSLARSLLA